jgi:hypothetical protein
MHAAGNIYPCAGKVLYVGADERIHIYSLPCAKWWAHLHICARIASDVWHLWHGMHVWHCDNELTLK